MNKTHTDTYASEDAAENNVKSHYCFKTSKIFTHTHNRTHTENKIKQKQGPFYRRHFMAECMGDFRNFIRFSSISSLFW